MVNRERFICESTIAFLFFATLQPLSVTSPLDHVCRDFIQRNKPRRETLGVKNFRAMRGRSFSRVFLSAAFRFNVALIFRRALLSFDSIRRQFRKQQRIAARNRREAFLSSSTISLDSFEECVFFSSEIRIKCLYSSIKSRTFTFQSKSTYDALECEEKQNISRKIYPK